MGGLCSGASSTAGKANWYALQVWVAPLLVVLIAVAVLAAASVQRGCGSAQVLLGVGFVAVTLTATLGLGVQARLLKAARAKAEAARAEAEATRARADQAIKALAESEQRYRMMGETVPFGVWWCNPKGEAEYVSPSFCELLDMTLEEQNRFGWTRRLVPEDVEPMMEHWMYCTRTGEPWDYEHRVIDRHGRINTVLSRGLPVRDEQGKIIAWVGVNLDITERKRIELELKQAKEALEEAMRAKDRFLANITHELRTPLTLILGPARKLKLADNLSAEQRQELTVIERNARVLLKNVNDLLDLSRLDAGRMQPEYAETDLARLARFVASHFESVADERQIQLAVETPPSLPGQVDPEKLQRVLFNLLSNAVKFTPAQGRVRLALQARDGHAVFAVEDTGPGIPEQMRQAIFERFRQVDSSSTRQYEGTGLGLAIVREFVTLHHGSVQAESADGRRGARFTVVLPLDAPEGAQVRAAESLADEQAAELAVAELRRPVGPRAEQDEGVAADAPLVLVVEDNPEMNAFIADSMRDRYRVATAFDGRQGVERALRLQPDLIISDIMMPRMSGEDLLRELRLHRQFDDVPVLILTARADESLRVWLLSHGAQDCLVKPFLAEELVARADGLIARKRKAESSLRESYELLRAVTEGIDDAVFVKDAQGCYRMINSAGALRLSRPVDEVIGKDDVALFDADTAARIRAVDERVMSQGRTVIFEETRTMNDGTARTYLTTKAPYRDNEDRVIGVLGIAHDITARKRAEEALQEATAEAQRRARQAEEREQIFSAMMEHIPMGITIADAPDVKIRAVSRYGRELTGQPRERLENIPVELHVERWRILRSDGVTPATNEELPLTRATQKGELVREEEFVLQRPDGSKVIILCTAAPIHDAQGTVTGGVIGWQDITERKRAENELRRLKDELELRVEQRTAELAAANRDLEAFGYTVSHDLRAPLRHMMGFIELLERKAGASLNEPGRRYVRIIAEAAQRMGNLIDDLLTLSRLGRASMTQTEVRLERIVEEARQQLTQEAAGRAVEWQIGALPVVQGDPTLLRAAMTNLLSNALKYTRPRNPARIEIDCRQGEGEWVCFVRDNGVGFDMQFVDKLFGVFQRLHAASEFEGTGIGLASVRRIIQRHGGQTWAEGQLDQGATFYFTLPRKASE